MQSSSSDNIICNPIKSKFGNPGIPIHQQKLKIEAGRQKTLYRNIQFARSNFSHADLKGN